MRAIFIDAAKKTVSEVELPGDSRGNLDKMYELIGCELITVAHEFENVDTLFVDDEGLLTLTPDTPFFFIGGAHQPFAGNGVILGGPDGEGDSTPARSTVEEIQAKVVWMTLADVRDSDAAQAALCGK